MEQKLKDKYFIDWESEVFGYGYGTGEAYTIPALRDFLMLCENDSYKYEVLEAELGQIPCWLLINILAKADIIDYGTSPRYGWLSEKGKLLKEYMLSKSTDELYSLTNTDSDYIHCYKDYCNCGEEEECNNPLFGKQKKVLDEPVS